MNIEKVLEQKGNDVKDIFNDYTDGFSMQVFTRAGQGCTLVIRTKC